MDDSVGKYAISLDPNDIVWKPDAPKYEELMSITEDIKLLSAQLQFKKLQKTIDFKKLLKAQEEAKLTPMYKEQLAAFYSFFIEQSGGMKYIYLQGVAGTGKTRVLARNIYLTMIKAGIYKPEQVIAMAKGTEVNNRLNKSLFGKDADTDLISKGIDKEALRKAFTDKLFVFLDEVGKLTPTEYKELVEVVEEINATRNAAQKLILFSFGS